MGQCEYFTRVGGYEGGWVEMVVGRRASSPSVEAEEEVVSAGFELGCLPTLSLLECWELVRFGDGRRLFAQMPNPSGSVFVRRARRPRPQGATRLADLVFDGGGAWGEVGGGELVGELGERVRGGLVGGAGDADAQVVPGGLAGDGVGISPAQAVAACG